MPDKRVRELANELGYDQQEMVSKINALGLFKLSVNPMSRLTEDEVLKVRRALKQDSGKGASTAASPTVRKSSGKKKPTAAEVAEAAVMQEEVSPIIRRGTKRAAEPVEEPAPIVMPEVQVRKRDPEVVVEAKPEVAPQQAVEAAPAPPLPAVVVPEREVVAAEPQVVPAVAAAPEEPPQAPAAAAAPEATPEEAAQAPVAPPAEVPTPAEPASAAAEAPRGVRARTVETGRGASAPARPGGAKVLGVIDLETINRRMRNERFDGGGGGNSGGGGNTGGPNTRPASRPAAGATGPAGAPQRPTRTQEMGPASNTAPSALSEDERRRRRNAGAPGGGPPPSTGRPPARGAGGNNDRDRYWRSGDDLYDGGRGKGRRRKGDKKARARQTEQTQAAEHKRVVRIEDVITVGDLGRQMGVKAGHLALKLLELGIPATINTTVDFDTATLVAEEFGYTVENVAFDITRFYDTTPDAEETQQPRPPVVTVMGHVDHGKTSLLDAIRSASVTTGEAGGITQHIGAYTVKSSDGRAITFLDTPGHEAFTAMRARGAQATDIVVLVVAADDGVMPQTVEAISHAKAAGVPIVVAINKIDKPGSNPERIKQALTEYELLPEDWGGQTLFVEVSAKAMTNIDKLVESVLLQADVEELSAHADRDAQGLVIESRLDRGRGPLATVLVQRGTLKVGDIVVTGEHYGRVRTMMDYLGKELALASPSIPAEITGLTGVPDAGSPFFVVTDEKDAKRITEHVANQHRKEHMATMARSNINRLQDMLGKKGDAANKKFLKVILKGDVQGSVEALRQSFTKVGNDEVGIEVIHSAVGAITENDVNLAASSSDSAVVIVGFNVRPDLRAAEVAEKYHVEIMSFNIIYDAIDQLKQLLEGMLSPLKREKVLGHAEVRDIFQVPRAGTVAGCYVTDGLLRRNARARLVRDGKVVYDTTLASLRRFKDDVSEVKRGFECGTSLHNFNDIKLGDIIEAYEIEEFAATLA